MTLSNEEYLRAVDLAQGISQKTRHVNDRFWKTWAQEIARALLLAHSERRTPETHEICEVCHRMTMLYEDDGCGYAPEPGEDEFHCPLRTPTQAGE